MTTMAENKNLDSNKMKDNEIILSKDYKTELNKEGDIHIAQDVSIGAKEYSCCSIDTLRGYLDDDHNLYEILHENKSHKSYIDFDCKYKDIREYAEEKSDKQIKDEIVSIISGMMEDFLEEFNLCKDMTFNVLDASNTLKFSFHFTFNILLKNFNDSEIFHKKFLRYCNEMYKDDPEYHGFEKWIDKTVYTRNRNIRLPGQSKYGQDRPFKIYAGSKCIKDHILTAPTNLKPIVIPKGWVKPHKNKYRIIKSIETKTMEEYNEDEELLWLVEHTRHRGVSYEDWISWTWASVGAGVPIDVIRTEHYIACPEKYNEEKTDEIIKQFKDGKGLGKHSLIKWAAEEGHFLQREVEKKPTELSNKKEEHLTWLDLLKKYHDRVFESVGEIIQEINKDVSQVVSYIQGGQSVFTIYSNDERPFEMTKTLPILCLKYRDDKLISEITLVKLLLRYSTSFPLYNKIVFKPLNHLLKKNERNTWIGFQAEKRDSYDIDYIQPIINHIKDVLADGDIDIFKYIMSWMWQMIVQPQKKTGIFLLFYGDQGTGKTIIADFLIEHVIGKNLSFSTNGIKPLTQRFNGCTMSKIFCCCNELSSISDSGSNWHAGFDSMKNLITDKLISVEKKGLEHIMIDNHINFMGTTNNPNCIKVEKGDRRYACLEVSSKHKGNYEYFDKLGACMDIEGGNHFYNYMLNYPEEDLVDIRKIPNTQLRQNLIENSKNPVERFIDDLLNEEHVTDERNWIDKENKEIGKNKLYEEYMYWCGNNNETLKSKNWFFRTIPQNKLDIDLSKKPRKTINGNRVYYVKFL